MHGLTAGADDIFEGLCLLLVIEELGRGEIRAADDPAGSVLQDDVDQAIRTRVRKRVEHDVAQDAVDDRDRADPERERQRRDEGEAGRPRERADAVAEVAAGIVHPDEGLAPRLVLRHSGGVNTLCPGMSTSR